MCATILPIETGIQTERKESIGMKKLHFSANMMMEMCMQTGCMRRICCAPMSDIFSVLGKRCAA